VGNSVAVFNKTKIELPYDPAIPLLGIYPKELKASSQSNYLCIHVRGGIVHSGQEGGGNTGVLQQMNG